MQNVFEGLFTFDWLGAADAHWWPFQILNGGKWWKVNNPPD